MPHLNSKGLILIKNFFPKERILSLKVAVQNVFKIQFDHFGYEYDENEESFKNCMIRLFEEHFDVFQNCGKLIQSGLIDLYKLAYDPVLLEQIRVLGLENPLVCTRPVVFFNHPRLAKEKHYYKTPKHQDWTSMLASSDSVVVWIPLIDVSRDNGAVVFYPGTHVLGPLEYKKVGGFSEVSIDENIYKPEQYEMKVGDIVIFSTFLIHESGEILNDQIRWSCHFRYTNLNDKDFIDRGFPSPYLYKSTTT